MIIRRSLLVVILSFTSCLLSASTNNNSRFAYSLPMQVTINQRQAECLHEKLDEGEKVTVSVFILSGSQLKATWSVEGPIADLDVDSGLELYTQSMGFAPSGRKSQRTLSYSQEKREEKKLAQLKKVRQDGEPLLYTTSAPEAGWYRMCVTSNWNQVVAEMEMRKESELGGLNDEGHVRTYEEKQMIDEDQELEEDTASAEGIKDEDFTETRDKVKDLRRLLNEIQSMQQKERRRLTVHAETNEHSHSSMVLNSLMETLLFMAVTGYQVYTIRKWFSGAPVLGR
ncbi:hypothetical protein FRACYDRAFT_236928 [Fragilariopsis cylindrus CCMP1102]|uniref:GOLD domain-containing protein n=1 Tax=Fragilariopsis cylindrus CCMP1102 TaxID=635003 RepID=A0A1E7FKE0_9STRA|nr:hypothetical protein FRACYDRAFT_236928 [Fragilariopsis cylindrus CCMP1102]|eukprot:OEU18649.1 hypothetical protein FRACYDRAFT_236928 [Fragilariopsis cylindrus CCMP1102]